MPVACASAPRRRTSFAAPKAFGSPKNSRSRLLPARFPLFNLNPLFGLPSGILRVDHPFALPFGNLPFLGLKHFATPKICFLRNGERIRRIYPGTFRQREAPRDRLARVVRILDSSRSRHLTAHLHRIRQRAVQYERAEESEEDTRPHAGRTEYEELANDFDFAFFHD